MQTQTGETQASVTLKFIQQSDLGEKKHYITLDFSENPEVPQKVREEIINKLKGLGSIGGGLEINDIEIMGNDYFKITPAIYVNFKPVRRKEALGHSFNQSIHSIIEVVAEHNKLNGMNIRPIIDQSCFALVNSLNEKIESLRRQSVSTVKAVYEQDLIRMKANLAAITEAKWPIDKEYPEDRQKLQKEAKERDEREKKREEDQKEKEAMGGAPKEQAISAEENERLFRELMAGEEGQEILTVVENEEYLENYEETYGAERVARDELVNILKEIALSLLNFSEKYPNGDRNKAIFFQDRQEQVARIGLFLKEISEICSKYEEKHASHYFYDAESDYTIFHRVLSLLDHHSLLISTVNDLAFFDGLYGNDTISSFYDTVAAVEEMSKEKAEKADIAPIDQQRSTSNRSPLRISSTSANSGPETLSNFMATIHQSVHSIARGALGAFTSLRSPSVKPAPLEDTSEAKQNLNI